MYSVNWNTQMKNSLKTRFILCIWYHKNWKFLSNLEESARKKSNFQKINYQTISIPRRHKTISLNAVEFKKRALTKLSNQRKTSTTNYFAFANVIIKIMTHTLHSFKKKVLFLYTDAATIIKTTLKSFNGQMR